MKHGGDLLSYQHLYHGEFLDFSSNINPLGYPKILDEILTSKVCRPRFVILIFTTALYGKLSLIIWLSAAGSHGRERRG